MVSEELRQYNKEYYQKNKERLRVLNAQAAKRFRDTHVIIRNKEKDKETKKIYYENHKEELRQQSKENYEKNKDRAKEYYKKYYEENKDKLKEKFKQYYLNNK